MRTQRARPFLRAPPDEATWRPVLPVIPKTLAGGAFPKCFCPRAPSAARQALLPRGMDAGTAEAGLYDQAKHFTRSASLPTACCF